MPFGPIVFSFLVAATARLVLLAALCALTDLLLRSKTAELRFALWRGLLAVAFFMPLLLFITPPLAHSAREFSPAERIVLTVGAAGSAPNVPAEFSGNAHPASLPSETWEWLAVFLYVAVFSTLLVRLLVAVRQLAGLARRSDPIVDAEFRELAHELWLASGARLQARFAESNELTVPVTLEPLAFDLDEPWIILPNSWRVWDHSKLRAVLTHELMHVRRRDANTAMLAEVAVCLFWFNPACWYARSRLRLLAEEACDELTLRSFTPERYAKILIEFAEQVTVSGGRFLAGANAVVSRSNTRKRIERLFLDGARLHARKRLLAATIAVVFVPAIYLSAAARFESAAPHQGRIDEHFGQLLNDSRDLSADQVADLKSRLKADPQNLDIRTELLFYFQQHLETNDFSIEVLWFIQHHPDSPALEMTYIPHREVEAQSPGAIASIRQSWEQALREKANSAEVLFNAAHFFTQEDPERALQLLREAKTINPGSSKVYAGAEAQVYAGAEMALLRTDHPYKFTFALPDPVTAGKLRAALYASDDPDLLSAVGVRLAEFNPGQLPSQQTRALELTERAVDLDPSNPQWKELLEWAKTAAVRQQNYRDLSRVVKPGTLQLAARVAEGNLIKKVDPVYPPLALRARIQGTVEFTVTIDKEGHVESVQLVRGHPLLVKAAKEAVLQWEYRPTLLNGQPVEVTTEVLIPFNLN